mmetsp:Transcript_16145/g.2674  ORF Transcript_16145/g.2674 Transcript_16145/m.2674 type:complete len:86 (+) Transcript_16145:195-452(+)
MLDIVDTTGAEMDPSRFQHLLSQAHGFLIVFDITNVQSYRLVNDYRSMIVDKHDLNYPMVLVGNKCDLDSKRTVNTSHGLEKATL